MSDQPYLSIISTTHNNFSQRGGALQLVVTALGRMELPFEAEYVIVDDGSTDETQPFLSELSRQMANGLDVSVVSTEHTGNRAKCRNRAIGESEGELLLFLDDDTFPLRRDSIAAAVDSWQTGAFACGARRYWTPPSWDVETVEEMVRNEQIDELTSWAHLPENSVNRLSGHRSLQEYSFLSNFGLLHRDAIEEVGGFDDEFEHWGYEDADLMVRLLASGYDFVNLFDTTAVVHLNHPLDKPRGASESNRELYYERMGDRGLIFEMNRLFDSEPGTHTNIVYPRPNARSRRDPPAVEVSVPDRLPAVSRSDPQPKYVRRISYTDGRQQEPLDTRSFEEQRVSVIISTANNFSDRNGSIEHVLTALESQHYQNFEVIVVDDGSTDGTPAFLSSFESETELDLRVERLEDNSGNRSLARNRGAELASGELYLFLDDDTVPGSTSALETLLTLYEPGTFLCGAQRFWTDVEWNREEYLRRVEEDQYSWLRERSWVPKGINRREGYRALFEFSHIGNFGTVGAADFHRVGGFDAENLDQWGREDIDLMLRLYLDDVDFVHLYDHLSVIHLNHPIKDPDLESRERSYDRYMAKERELGYAFKLNHLYGVTEGDGDHILEEI